MNVRRVRSWGGVMSYAAKYMGKSAGDVEAPEGVGRYWGVMGQLPEEWQEFPLTREGFFAVRRLIGAHRRAQARQRAEVTGRPPRRWRPPREPLAGVWCFMESTTALRVARLQL